VLVGQLEQFAAQVQQGLQQAEWQARRDIIRTVVKRVEIDEHQVRVVFRLSPSAPAHPFEGAPHDLQHCGGRVLVAGLQPAGG
jgi:site-specific DNA recombinase